MSLPKSKRRSSHRPWWAFLTGIMPRRALLGCCLMGAGTVAAASFEPPHVMPVNGGPVDVAVVDMNGDGKADMVVADYFSGKVSVLLGKGDGAFADPKDYAVGYGAFTIAVADINGDGRLDVVTVNGPDASVTVLLGNGDGTLQPAQNFDVGIQPRDVAVADVNGDGRPDILVINSYYNGGTGYGLVTVLRQNPPNPDGSLSFQADVVFDAIADLRGLEVADVTGDGILDIVTADTDSGNVLVLPGLAGGSFDVANLIALPVGSSLFFGIAVGDVNGDGRPDIVASNAANPWDIALNVLLNNGGGAFTQLPGISINSLPYSIAIGDLDGDGRPDVVTSSWMYLGGGASVGVLLGNGDGTFQAEQDFAAGGMPFRATIADVNGDGRPDIVTANPFGNTLYYGYGRYQGGSVSVLLNGTGPMLPRQDFDGGGPAFAIAAADFDGDGVTDLVVANAVDATVSVLIGVGDGTFLDPLPYETYNDPTAVAAGDINGDGFPDIVVATYYSVCVLLNGQDGTFNTVLGPLWLDYDPVGVAIADMNSNGRPDIVTVGAYDDNGHTYGGVSILSQNPPNPLDGSISFGEPYEYEVETVTLPPWMASVFLTDLAVGDVDGDGKLDVVVVGTEVEEDGGNANRATRPPGSNGTSLAYILLGDGEGDLRQNSAYLTGQDPEAVALADVDADGRLDIVTANANENTVSVLLGAGAGTFAPLLNFAAGSYPSDVTIADMNGDGDLDIITSNAGESSVSILRGNGHGGFSSPETFAVGHEPMGVVAVELNGDGRLDLATSNIGTSGLPGANRQPGFGSGYDHVSILLSNPPPTITGTVAGQPVNDTATIAPFTGVTIADKDVPPEKLIVEVKLDDAAKGAFTTLNGFVDMGGGVYKFTGTPTECTNAIRGLVFTPTPNRVAAGTTETTTFTITANDGILPATKDSNTTVVVMSVNEAPILESPVTANPSPANPGEPVQFSAPFADPERGAVTYFWDFGDGTTSTDPSPSHTYTVPGIYTATVTVTDVTGAKTTGSVTVQVGNIAAMADAKLLVRLDFNRPGHDFIRLTAVVVLPEALTLSGRQFYVNIGGVTKLFTLDKNGKAKSGGDSIQVKPRKTGHPRTALVTVVLARGSFAAQLADEGYTTDPVKGKRVTVNCAVAIGDNLYAVPQPQKYTVKPGPMGFSTNPPAK